jgi:hypothetical protein
VANVGQGNMLKLLETFKLLQVKSLLDIIIKIVPFVNSLDPLSYQKFEVNFEKKNADDSYKVQNELRGHTNVSNADQIRVLEEA